MATLEERVNRIYAALEGIREEDLTKFPPKVVDEDGFVQTWLDFRGGMSDAEFENAAQSLISNVGHVDAYLRKWAGKDNAKLSTINSTLGSCRTFLIIKDLANYDKHPYPPRDGGHSGLAPQLRDVGRPMRAKTAPVEGSIAGFSMDPRTGEIEYFGSVDVVITGTVVDSDGNPVGDLYDMAEEAVDAIEALVTELGIRGA